MVRGRSLIVLFLGILFLTSNVSAQESADIIKLKDKIPSFKLVNGSKVVSDESLKGKVVLINFFATWCPPCRKELPHLQSQVWEKYKANKDFELLVVGREHSEMEINTFVEKNAYKMPFYPDPQRGMYSKFAENTIPRNYIVNRKGEIIYAAVGFSEESFKELENILQKELSEQ